MCLSRPSRCRAASRRWSRSVGSLAMVFARSSKISATPRSLLMSSPPRAWWWCSPRMPSTLPASKRRASKSRRVFRSCSTRRRAPAAGVTVLDCLVSIRCRMLMWSSTSSGRLWPRSRRRSRLASPRRGALFAAPLYFYYMSPVPPDSTRLSSLPSSPCFHPPLLLHMHITQRNVQATDHAWTATVTAGPRRDFEALERCWFHWVKP
mmetsp:Transcript_5715/g.11632  ORF Transcript_5715/g.11632 Transcript_5715/m.11632 type:complete len:207 (+) Transcript_5715:559-1179(+)